MISEIIGQFGFGRYAKIPPNELCPCNSGKRYGECCYSKADKVFHAEREGIALLQKIFKSSLLKTCLKKGCTAKTKEVISAHAMQENKVIQQLCVDRKVYMQSAEKLPPIMQLPDGTREPTFFLDEIHKNTATTQTCFCKTHDNDIFAVIEKDDHPFDPTNLEQQFVFAYRTFAFEYYKVLAVCNFFSKCCSQIPQTMREPQVVRQYRENGKKMIEMDYYKVFFDSSLEQNDFSGLETLVITLPYAVAIANYSSIAPLYDVEGKWVHSLYKGKMRRLFITVFPDNDKSHILISALKSDLKVYRKFFDRARTASQELMLMYLNALIPLYSENMIISPLLMDYWNEEQQAFIQFMVNEMEINRYQLPMKCIFQNIHKTRKKITQSDLENMKLNIFQQILTKGGDCNANT